MEGALGTVTCCCLSLSSTAGDRGRGVGAWLLGAPCMVLGGWRCGYLLSPLQ